VPLRPPVAFRLAQALNHGTDHRSQICTALTTLGVEPPAVDVMSYGVYLHRITEKLLAASADPSRRSGETYEGRATRTISAPLAERTARHRRVRYMLATGGSGT
jgi:hypothetical protein